MGLGSSDHDAVILVFRYVDPAEGAFSSQLFYAAFHSTIHGHIC